MWLSLSITIGLSLDLKKRKKRVFLFVALVQIQTRMKTLTLIWITTSLSTCNKKLFLLLLPHNGFQHSWAMEFPWSRWKAIYFSEGRLLLRFWSDRRAISAQMREIWWPWSKIPLPRGPKRNFFGNLTRKSPAKDK